MKISLPQLLLLVIVSVSIAVGYALTKDTQAIELVHTCNDKNRHPAVSKETCYSQEFQRFAYTVGPEDAFDTLFVVQTLDQDAIGCHFIGHGIGYGTYERNSKNWRGTFRTINQACTYGAMHGILEMAITTLPNGLTRDTLPTICGKNPPGDCNHIIGHLTLVETRGNIPEALTLCQPLHSNYQREFCETGVFMEHITAFNLINHGYVDETYLDWARRVPELKDLCLSQTGNAAQACWKEITHAVIVRERNDARRVFSFCDQASSQASQNKCKTHSIGIMAAGFNFELTKAQSICEVPQDEPYFQNHCYAQLVASALSTVPNKVANTITFCAQLNEEYQKDCFSMVGNIIRNGLYSESEIRKLCSQAPSQLQIQCQKGGNVNFNPHYTHEEGD